MKYRHAIRAQLKHDGFVVSVQRHGKIHTVAAAKGGITNVVQVECLAAAVYRDAAVDSRAGDGN